MATKITTKKKGTKKRGGKRPPRKKVVRVMTKELKDMTPKEVLESEIKFVDDTGGEGLLPNWIAFIDEYMANGFNGMHAYLVVYKGTNKDSAKANASRLIANVNVKKEIEYRLNRKSITSDAIVGELWDIGKNYRGEKTLGPAVTALSKLADISGLVDNGVNQQFFSENYLVYMPIVSDDDKKGLDVLLGKSRLIE